MVKIEYTWWHFGYVIVVVVSSFYLDVNFPTVQNCGGPIATGWSKIQVGNLHPGFVESNPGPESVNVKNVIFSINTNTLQPGAVSDFGWIFQGKHDNLPCFSLIILIQREIRPIKTKSVRMWSYSSANYRDSDMTPRWSHPRKRQNMNLI